MAKILLIEDNLHIMNINESALKMRNYRVLCASTLTRGWELIQFHKIDLILLDVMLPDGNGIEFCKKIKGTYSIPIIFLTALGENSDIIDGLRAGGDDYIAKPYDLDVLIARIETKLKNSRVNNNKMKYGPITIDLISMKCYLNGENINLTKKELSLLLLLIEHANQLVKKDELFENIWGYPMEKESKALWTTISRLKKKLNTEESGITITVFRQEGYILEKV